jgi:outer membrane receptor protein involved in Fe transport
MQLHWEGPVHAFHSPGPQAHQIGGVSFNVTAGEVHSRGVEVDFAGRITPQLSVIASYAFIDAEVT